ncbi:MAG: Nif3-like dinuclear metal center hexameric protein [Clostridia bacterium]|nr:Nif3-like dinuclear metal center hexameric protein [Clostridia bacterium]
MTVHTLYAYLDSLYPFSSAEEWDNSGFLVGSPEDEVQKILVCLDITPAVLRHAAQHGYNVILSHHPLLFRPIQQLTEADTLQSMLRYAVRNDLNIISLHTNLDKSPSGTGAALCKALGFSGCSSSGYVWTVSPSAPCTLEALGNHVSSCLDAPVRLYGSPGTPVGTIGLIPGSGMGEIADAAALGCTTVITGDVKHHAALDALAEGISIIDAGHVGTELPVLNSLKEALQGWEEMLELSIVVDIYTRNPYTYFSPIQEEVD